MQMVLKFIVWLQRLQREGKEGALMRSSDSLHYSTQGLIINQLNQGYHFIFCTYLFDFLMNVSSSIKTWYWSMLCYKGYFSHKNAFASILKQGSCFFVFFLSYSHVELLQGCCVKKKTWQISEWSAGLSHGNPTRVNRQSINGPTVVGST